MGGLTLRRRSGMLRVIDRGLLRNAVDNQLEDTGAVVVDEAARIYKAINYHRGSKLNVRAPDKSIDEQFVAFTGASNKGDMGTPCGFQAPWKFLGAEEVTGMLKAASWPD